MPAFKSYKEAAHSLPADTKAVKQLRTEYLKEVDQQEKALKKDRDYISISSIVFLTWSCFLSTSDIDCSN